MSSLNALWDKNALGEQEMLSLGWRWLRHNLMGICEHTYEGQAANEKRSGCAVCVAMTIGAETAVPVLVCGSLCFWGTLQGVRAEGIRLVLPRPTLNSDSPLVLLFSPDSVNADILVILHVCITSHFHFETPERGLRPRVSEIMSIS